MRPERMLDAGHLLIRPDHRWVCAVIGWSRHAEVGKEGDSRRNLRVRFAFALGMALVRFPSRSDGDHADSGSVPKLA